MILLKYYIIVYYVCMYIVTIFSSQYACLPSSSLSSLSGIIVRLFHYIQPPNYSYNMLVNVLYVILELFAIKLPPIFLKIVLALMLDSCLIARLHNMYSC